MITVTVLFRRRRERGYKIMTSLCDSLNGVARFCLEIRSVFVRNATKFGRRFARSYLLNVWNILKGSIVDRVKKLECPRNALKSTTDANIRLL